MKTECSFVISTDIRGENVIATLSDSLSYPQVVSVVRALRSGGQSAYLLRVLETRNREVVFVPVPAV